MPRVTVVTRAQKDQGACDYPSCDRPILAGQSYKWIKPRAGKFTRGVKRSRHAEHPTWQVWEYSSSTAARIAQLDHDARAALEGVTTAEDAMAAFEGAADAVDELTGEKREGAENIETGFGHETQQSQEMSDLADSLESWAEELRNVDLPEFPEPEEQDCEECGGSGKVLDAEPRETDCEECGGTGRVTPDEPTADQLDKWRTEVESLLDDLLGNSPA